jgi:hypothetical protein
VADLADQLDLKALKRVESKSVPYNCHLLNDKNYGTYYLRVYCKYEIVI